MNCNKCGATGLSPDVKFCEYCGSSVSPELKQVSPQNPQAIAAVVDADFSGLHLDYQQAFREIEANGGKPKVIWNWWAFAFSAFWYLSKGMWAKGIIIFIVLFFSAGAAAPIAWIYAGLLGNYDYYLLKVKNNQFW